MNLPHFEMKAEVILRQACSLTFSARRGSFIRFPLPMLLTASLVHSQVELRPGSRKIKA